MHRFAFLPLALFLLLIVGALVSLLSQLDANTLQMLLVEEEIRFALLLSLLTALTSLLLALLIGLPAGWAMARSTFRGKKWLNTLLDLPMVTPPLVAGIGLLLLLGQNGVVGRWLPWIADSLFSVLGVIIAQTYVATSIIVRNAIAAFSQIDNRFVHTAHNLGLTPCQSFFLIEIPLCWRALAGGMVIALARCLGEFGATLMLAGATRLKTETLPIAVYLNIASGDFTIAIGCAAALLLIACLLLMGLHFFQSEGETIHVER